MAGKSKITHGICQQAQPETQKLSKTQPNTAGQGAPGEQEHTLDDPCLAHINSDNFVPPSHEQRASRRDFWRDIKELVLTEQVLGVGSCQKQLGGHLETHTMTKERLLLIFQHHTRDDSNVKLGLKEPHKRKTTLNSFFLQ